MSKSWVNKLIILLSSNMYTDVWRQKAGSTTPVQLCKQMYYFQSFMFGHAQQQHVAARTCFQSESTLLCKHSPLEGYKMEWKEHRSTFEFKMATVNDVLRPPKEHLCDQCGYTFTQRCTLLRRVRTQHGGVWRCARCSSTFNHQANYIYHTRQGW